MAEKGVYSIPTLAVQTDYHHFLHDPAVLDHPLAKALTTDALIAAYRDQETVEKSRERLDRSKTREKMILESVGVMASAGVAILSGTDAGNYGTLQGYSIHRELLKLVASGLSNWEALAASTTRAGKFLGRDFGVSPGSEGHLVVLDASPIDDIRNTMKIHMVIHRGKVVDRDGLLGQ